MLYLDLDVTVFELIQNVFDVYFPFIYLQLNIVLK
jgi:hypothetical protein